MGPRQRSRVIAQRAGERWVLLDMDGGQYYTVDEVGGRVWQLCDGSRSVADISAVVSSEYEAAPAVIESDVRAFVDELTAERLLE
jgi:coenzyme PQQ biosynthesis protein PqqD